MDVQLTRTTLPSEAEAAALAKRLTGSGLAACVHVSAIQSTYPWEGALHRDAEWVVEARSLASHGPAVVAAMTDGHPYDVPLVESWTARVHGAAYARWMESVSKPMAGN